VDYFYPVPVPVKRQKAARFSDHVGIELDTPDLAGASCRKTRQNAGAAAQFEHTGAIENDMIDGCPEGAHPVLVHQHVVVVMQGNELAEIVSAGLVFT
jgi:hypothetical protein